jgi:hypothetical protein
MALVIGSFAVVGLLIYHLWLSTRIAKFPGSPTRSLRMFGLSFIGAVMWFVILWLTMLISRDTRWEAYDALFYLTTGLPALLPCIHSGEVIFGNVLVNAYLSPLVNLDDAILYILNFLLLVVGLFLLTNLVLLIPPAKWRQTHPVVSLAGV